MILVQILLVMFLKYLCICISLQVFVLVYKTHVSRLQVLCELFQSAPQRGNVPISGNISGFIRRLFLQLMLEDEKVSVFLQSPCPVGSIAALFHF